MSEPRWLTLYLHNDDGQWVTLPAKVIDHFPNFRFLFYLVLSAPDSFEYQRTGDEIEYLPNPNITDTPWRDDVGRLILRHFKGDLLAIMPQGRWYLGVRGREEGEQL